MSTESLPNFTKPAAKFWAEIPQRHQEKVVDQCVVRGLSPRSDYHQFHWRD